MNYQLSTSKYYQVQVQCPWAVPSNVRWAKWSNISAHPKAFGSPRRRRASMALVSDFLQTHGLKNLSWLIMTYLMFLHLELYIYIMTYIYIYRVTIYIYIVTMYMSIRRIQELVDDYINSYDDRFNHILYIQWCYGDFAITNWGYLQYFDGLFYMESVIKHMVTDST